VKFEAKQKRTVVVSYSVAPAEVESEKGETPHLCLHAENRRNLGRNIGEAQSRPRSTGLPGPDIVTITPAHAPLGASGASERLVWQFKDFKPTQH